MNIGPNAENKVKAVFTPDELAEYLAISKATVYRLVNKRRLPFIKIGGVLRFRIDAVEKYFETESIEPIR